MAQTNKTIWIVISPQLAISHMSTLIDRGHFTEANQYINIIHSFKDKIRSIVDMYNGQIHSFLDNRLVLEVPEAVLDELPQILDNYMSNLKHQIFVGLGLNFSEAIQAMKNSIVSGQIELYNPNEINYRTAAEQTAPQNDINATNNIPKQNQELNQSQLKNNNNQDIQLLEVPPNLFDPLAPSSESNQLQFKMPPKEEQQIQIRPSIDTELSAEAALIHDMLLSFRDALQNFRNAPHETTVNGPVSDTAAQNQSELPEKPVVAPTQKEAPSEYAFDVPKNVPESSEPQKNTLERLGPIIRISKTTLQWLKDENPIAYQKAVEVLHKLLLVLRYQRSTLSHSEIPVRSRLDKTFRDHIRRRRKIFVAKLPVGSRMGRSIKVLAGGSPRWRQAAAGQVKDNEGNPISVRTWNRAINQA